MSDSVTPEAEGAAKPQMPTSQPVLLRAMKWGIVVTVVMVLAFALIGWAVAGSPGLVGGVIGSAFGGFFLLLTIGSIAFANRFIDSPNYLGLFFGIVLGGWVLKFVIFIVVSLLLRDQPWLDPVILFIGIVASVLVSLAIDSVIVAKSRIPVVGGV
ncbi:3-oxoacyl-ACP reductase [Leucobacter sp. gxy201]|uniref:3-oxoacyl-ACP reductase n=1 Tax=Leucobacter sp. gxy201 TaxID=2957200 RepID=UPI003DA04B59